MECGPSAYIAANLSKTEFLSWNCVFTNQLRKAAVFSSIEEASDFIAENELHNYELQPLKVNYHIHFEESSDQALMNFQDLNDEIFINECRNNALLVYNDLLYFNEKSFFHHVCVLGDFLKKFGFSTKEYIVAAFYIGFMDFCNLDRDSIAVLSDDKIAEIVSTLSRVNYDYDSKYLEGLYGCEIAQVVKAADITHSLRSALRLEGDDDKVRNLFINVVSIYDKMMISSLYKHPYSSYVSLLKQRFPDLNLYSEKLKLLSSKHGFRIEVISIAIIKVHSKYDVWKIAFCNSNRIQLFHLNSGKNSAYHLQREFKRRFAELVYIFDDIADHDRYVEENRKHTVKINNSTSKE